jgi:hypothetical protein
MGIDRKRVRQLRDASRLGPKVEAPGPKPEAPRPRSSKRESLIAFLADYEPIGNLFDRDAARRRAADGSIGVVEMLASGDASIPEALRLALEDWDELREVLQDANGFAYEHYKIVRMRQRTGRGRVAAEQLDLLRRLDRVRAAIGRLLEMAGKSGPSDLKSTPE